MTNMKAPVLLHDVPKDNGNQFYQIPQTVCDKVFTELGNSSAQLRIMIVLIGTKPGFSVSEKWILERTGLLHASYINARKALVKRGWLAMEEGKITVCFNAILG